MWTSSTLSLVERTVLVSTSQISGETEASKGGRGIRGISEIRRECAEFERREAARSTIEASQVTIDMENTVRIIIFDIITISNSNVRLEML